MTLIEIENRVKAIAVAADRSDENAHAEEDELHRDFIAYVASGESVSVEELREKALAVLKTNDLDFAHWYA